MRPLGQNAWLNLYGENPWKLYEKKYVAQTVLNTSLLSKVGFQRHIVFLSLSLPQKD